MTLQILNRLKWKHMYITNKKFRVNHHQYAPYGMLKVECHVWLICQCNLWYLLAAKKAKFNHVHYQEGWLKVGYVSQAMNDLPLNLPSWTHLVVLILGIWILAVLCCSSSPHPKKKNPFSNPTKKVIVE